MKTSDHSAPKRKMLVGRNWINTLQKRMSAIKQAKRKQMKALRAIQNTQWETGHTNIQLSSDDHTLRLIDPVSGELTDFQLTIDGDYAPVTGGIETKPTAKLIDPVSGEFTDFHLTNDDEYVPIATTNRLYQTIPSVYDTQPYSEGAYHLATNPTEATGIEHLKYNFTKL